MPVYTRVRGLAPKRLHTTLRAAYHQVGSASSRLRLEPSFMVIGGQRCGTTSIFKVLAEHPQVLRPPVEKGVDYYTLNSFRTLSWYRGHFPIASIARNRTAAFGSPVAFEACTYYMFHPLAVKRIARDYPTMKLVVMLRDPVERAFSAYKHEFARGFETERDFGRALDLETPRLEGEIERIVEDAHYESFAHRHHAYQLRGQYAEQLLRVYSNFPKSQVHILESEAFFADPAQEYAKLTDFLDLRPFSPRRFDQHNARPSSPMPEGLRQRLTRHYASHDELLGTILGRPPRWARQ